jgi:hypothetical protein
MNYRTDLQTQKTLPEHRKVSYGRTHSSPWGGIDYACALTRTRSFTTRVALWFRGLWS